MQGVHPFGTTARGCLGTIRRRISQPQIQSLTSKDHTWSDSLGLAPEGCPRQLGITSAAQRAIEKLENIKKDPLGDVNSQANHNHYNAARREASGEVVARKADGTPFDHIAELKQARDGLDRIRRVLDREISSPPETLTDRGLEVLITKRKNAIAELDRLNGFLHSIGHRT
ncbi:polymorphic toxin type 28 domain-containing protein [Streptomyces misionensis]|uniref:polymorphic toxin type 28 domain-containing protein n=1 Tax=Streptomyces misionensis TaxID=67331 RepID=UPI003681AFA1